MISLEDKLKTYFGDYSLKRAVLEEEKSRLTLYALVEKVEARDRAVEELSSSLGLEVDLVIFKMAPLEELFLDVKGFLDEKIMKLPQDLSYDFDDRHLILSSSDKSFLENQFSFLEEHLMLWFEGYSLEITPKDDREEFDLSLDEELRKLVKESSQAPVKKTDKPTKKPHKYLQKIKGPIIKISDILKDEQGTRVAIQGELFEIEKRELRSGKKLIDLSIYDGSDSLGCKFFCDGKDEEVLDQLLSEGNHYTLQGNLNFDSYSREMVIFPTRINRAPSPEVRMDSSLNKRVELHLHTSMSEIDGITEIEEYIKRAKAWGHKALAITDLATLHSYPKALEWAQKEDLKILYGMEILYYDDKKKVVDLEGHGFHDSFVALDLETTGLRNDRDEIIEIGAVKIQNFQIVDSYQTLVKPRQRIPYHITEITGIGNDMVASAPRLEEVFGDFMNFIGDSPIVGHNLNFDSGFIKRAADSLGYEFTPRGVDTLALSRLLLRDIKRHRLNQVARKLKISQEEHHRALDDALVCGKIFLEFLRRLENQGIESFDEINSLVDNDYYISASRKYTMSVLARDTQSLKKLYEMASISSLNYLEYNQPLVPRSLLDQFRDNFILGSSGSDGWLVDNIIMCTPQDEILEFIKIYDYLEIQPLGQYSRYLKNQSIKNLEDAKEIHERILELGEISSIDVVATGDVRYLDEDGYLYRNIVRSGQNKNLSLEDKANHFFRTTEEMLAEFSHLGDRAEEVVIDNSNKIADMVSIIEPLPKGTFPPKIEGSDSELRDKCYHRAENKYGKPLPELVKTRLDYELDSIINNGFSVLYIIAEKLVKRSLESGYLVGSRGSVGSSFAATMAGITEVNPLPPHYYCEKCQYSEFSDQPLYDNGYDMPDKLCPACGVQLKKDGFNIPFESFMGFEGNKEPDIDLNFAPNIQGDIHKYTEELFGAGHVFKAGTVSKIAQKTAYGYIMNFYEKNEEDISSREINRIVKKITGVRRSTGQHPGGIIVLPQDQSIYNFTPIQYPANDPSSGVITTHFDYDALQGKLLKLDILGHDVPSLIHDLEKMTGVDSSQVRFDDKEILSIFNSTEGLGLKDRRYDLKKGTLGIPEFGTSFVRSMLEDTKPENLSDLVRISGLSHGTNVWINNAQDLVREGTITIKDVIATREQIMVYGIQMGIPRDQAFNIMERVRKGRGLSEEDLDIMQKVKVPQWYLNSCNRISYMFPKAHAVAYVLMSFRIAYYKLFHPLAFYASYFSTKVEDFDAQSMTRGIEGVLNYLNTVDFNNDMTKKDQDYFGLMEVVYEMYARGLDFAPVDIYKSHAWKFLIEDNRILPPLRSVSGLGLNAAMSIVRERSQVFISIEDLQTRAKLNKTAIEGLKNLGCLEDMQESNQISLFDFL